MKELLYNVWLVVQWFFGEFCIQLISAPIGILKDTFDTIELTWKAIGILAGILGIIVTLIIKWLSKGR